MSARLITLLSASLALALAAGCQPRIGDSCGSYINCDINGSRICDLSSTNGYCTQRNCDVGTCPQSESLCIQFGTELRVAENYCMKRCNTNSDCRVSDGYACLSPADVGGVALDILDGGSTQKFCVVVPTDGGVPPADGG